MEKFSFNGINTFANVLKVIDGDTVSVSLEISLQINESKIKSGHFKLAIRLFGINCCELNSKDKEEKELAERAKERLKDLCGNKIFIKMHNFDKYGRILGEIFYDDTSSISFNEILLNEGLAKRYMC